MKLLVQPEDGAAPLIKGIEKARTSVQLAIFRLDNKKVERALRAAVSRVVAVRALIASKNRGGEEKLRQLEMRLLEYGVTVARTDNDKSRYHDKYMIVDGRELHLMAFNLTHLDMDRSRSFGVVTESRKLVQEAIELFEADSTRQPFAPKRGGLVISPLNARKRLADFIRKSRKQLLIFDPKISDGSMIRLLQERAKAGVEIKIIGKLSVNDKALAVSKLPKLRLHTRTILRDGRDAIVGSQSLRKSELDARRELGIIVHERKVIERLSKTFQEDWASAELAKSVEKHKSETARSAAEIVSDAVIGQIPALAPVMESALQQVAKVKVNGSLDRKEVEATVQSAVKRAVGNAVEEIVKDLVEEAHAAGEK
ncbi:MAG TPA: phospholipase D-like domain-containing protein [Terriglobia bacterium]|nr:phospholipase D-like domain-containing protein [Terriglobia bacterium]